MKTNIFLILFYYYILISIKSIQKEEDNLQTIMNLYYSEKANNYTAKISNASDENAIASAIYNKSYEKVGWDYLAISSYDKKDNKYNDSNKAYAMGYLEGILTKDRIYSHYINFMHYFLYDYKDNIFAIEFFFGFFLQNIEYMYEKSLDNMDSDPYWEHVHFVYQQICGLYDGYISVAEKDKKIEFYELLVLAGTPDAKEIASSLFRKLPNFEKMTKEEIEEYSILNTHCSAIVKLAKNFSDIWFGHNTWNYYVLMIRIFKEYHFVTNKGNEKSKTVVFSSYPATLSSIDEFYYLDSKLLIMGTSNSIYNSSLYDSITHESIFIWVRQIVSNRLASSAENWTEIFKRENSGTNNGQTMILDMNKIDLKNKKLDNKALMIIEQIPKYTETVDVTDYLRKGYWPSYNVPFTDKIYKDSGYGIFENEDGSSENIRYTQCPRAKIFKRNQEKIETNEDFKVFMRYNDFENDELSENDPTYTIAARGDLRNSCHGAIDAKFVSIKELLEGKNIAHIISGPTNDQQKTFSWSNTTCSKNKPDQLSHVGQNDIWNFPWIEYKIQLFDNNKPSEDGKNGKENENQKNKGNNNSRNTLIILIIFIVAFIIIIIISIIIVVKNNQKYSELKETINKISFKEENNDDSQNENLLIN